MDRGSQGLILVHIQSSVVSPVTIPILCKDNCRVTVLLRGRLLPSPPFDAA